MSIISLILNISISIDRFSCGRLSLNFITHYIRKCEWHIIVIWRWDDDNGTVIFQLNFYITCKYTIVFLKLWFWLSISYIECNIITCILFSRQFDLHAPTLFAIIGGKYSQFILYGCSPDPCVESISNQSGDGDRIIADNSYNIADSELTCLLSVYRSVYYFSFSTCIIVIYYEQYYNNIDTKNLF